DPAAVEQLLRPVLVEFPPLLGCHREALVEPALRKVPAEPRPDLAAEVLGVRRIGQIHRRILTDGSRGGLVDACVRLPLSSTATPSCSTAVISMVWPRSSNTRRGARAPGPSACRARRRCAGCTTG